MYSPCFRSEFGRGEPSPQVCFILYFAVDAFNKFNCAAPLFVIRDMTVRHLLNTGDKAHSRFSIRRSIRRSGRSHMTATSTYMAAASHWFTNASPMPME